MKESKIKLRNAVVLENQEMKMIFGGSGADIYCGGGIGTCSSPCNIGGASGTCTVRDGICGCLIKS